jgi:phage/plasmid-associated DNA primase
MFEDNDMDLYYLKTIASSLSGENPFQEMYFWTGRGGNGKSLSADIIKKSFGGYYGAINVSCLTNITKSSNATSPELANKKGIRILVSSEPESTEKIQTSMVKKITGSDDIQARELYKNTTTFNPQFTLFIQMNDEPELSKYDGGIARRLVKVDFPFSFKDHPVHPNGRPKITNLRENKILTNPWRDEFILMLIETYNEFIKGASKIEKPDLGYYKTFLLLTFNDGSVLKNFRYDHGMRDESLSKQLDWYIKTSVKMEEN